MNIHVQEALDCAVEAVNLPPQSRDKFQQACIILALEIRRLNEMINEMYANKTPTGGNHHAEP